MLVAAAASMAGLWAATSGSRYRGSAQLETNEGSISVAAFCGFVLQATTKTGNINVGTGCSADRLEAAQRYRQRRRVRAGRALRHRRRHEQRQRNRARRDAG